ncbi:MAG: RNA polymerase sigma factor [Opitutus sp.]
MDILPESREYPRSADTDLLQAGFRYALSLTHHRQNAEDLIQEAWLKLCRRYGGVGSQAALFTTVRHLFIDDCRRKQVIAFEVLEPDDRRCAKLPLVHPGTKPDLETLLGALRPVEREAIFLHHVHGHTAEEIAVLTAQPRGTVLSLLHRAFEKLRRSVSPAGNVSDLPGSVAINEPPGSSVTEAQ